MTKFAKRRNFRQMMPFKARGMGSFHRAALACNDSIKIRQLQTAFRQPANDAGLKYVSVPLALVAEAMHDVLPGKRKTTSTTRKRNRIHYQTSFGVGEPMSQNIDTIRELNATELDAVGGGLSLGLGLDLNLSSELGAVSGVVGQVGGLVSGLVGGLLRAVGGLAGGLLGGK